MHIICSKASANCCKISGCLGLSLRQTNESRPFPAGGMIKTRPIFTDNPFINHGNKMAIMTATQWNIFTSSAVSRQQQYLNSQDKKGNLGSQKSRRRSHCLVLFFPEGKWWDVCLHELYMSLIKAACFICMSESIDMRNVEVSELFPYAGNWWILQGEGVLKGLLYKHLLWVFSLRESVVQQGL